MLVDGCYKRPPIVQVAVHLYHPIQFRAVVVTLGNRHILPVPSALERGIDREQALVGGIHRGTDIEVAR